SSMTFSVRYPSIAGWVRRVRRQGVLRAQRTCRGSALEWYPFVRAGDRLRPNEREQYLGALLAPDFCMSLDRLDRSVAEMEATIRGRGLIDESTMRPNQSGSRKWLRRRSTAS